VQLKLAGVLNYKCYGFVNLSNIPGYLTSW